MSVIKKLKALFDAATPGEWVSYVDISHISKVISTVKEGRRETTYCPALAMPDDANFIAAAHKAMPALLAAAEFVEAVAKATTQAEDEESGNDFGCQGGDGETICHLRSLAAKVSADLK